MNEEKQASKEEIWEFIKKLREENNMTQEDVANELHFSRDVISHIERGLSIPNFDKAIILSKLFNVSVYEIYAAKRLSNKSKQELEGIMNNTTNAINEKYHKKAKFLFCIITTLLIMLLAFLLYYFFNSYNSVKVYSLYGESENLKTNDGLIFASKDEIYLSLNVIPKGDFKIKKVLLKYSEETNEQIVYESDSSEIFITDLYGYEAFISYESLIKNEVKFYVEVTYDDRQETINLERTKLYENKKITFEKETKESTGEKYQYVNIMPQKIVDIFTKEDDIYTYSLKEKDKNISMTYDDFSNIFTVIEEDKKYNYSWIYNLEYKLLDYELIDNINFASLETKTININEIKEDEHELYEYFKENYLDKYIN